MKDSFGGEQIRRVVTMHVTIRLTVNFLVMYDIRRNISYYVRL